MLSATNLIVLPLLTAGYFHAPGALMCPLGTTAEHVHRHAPALPSVCMTFCAIDGFEAMQVMPP